MQIKPDKVETCVEGLRFRRGEGGVSVSESQVCHHVILEPKARRPSTLFFFC